MSGYAAVFLCVPKIMTDFYKTKGILEKVKSNGKICLKS